MADVLCKHGRTSLVRRATVRFAQKTGCLVKSCLLNHSNPLSVSCRRHCKKNALFTGLHIVRKFFALTNTCFVKFIMLVLGKNILVNSHTLTQKHTYITPIIYREPADLNSKYFSQGLPLLGPPKLEVSYDRIFLSHPQLNLNSTIRFYVKMTSHTTTTTHPYKLNVSNISAVSDAILTKFKGRLLGSSRTD